MLQALGVLARDLGQTAYLVGGMVRDVALGRENIDLDIAVEGDAEHLARVFARKTGGSVRGLTRFGTCKVESRAFGTIDIAAARSESYGKPGALPDVVKAGMGDDLARRDFTVNAMAVSLMPQDYGSLLDPFGGLDDVRRGRLRILHPRSFEDDPTRILRGIRFAARYGSAFDGSTLRLLKACVARGCMGSVSGARVYTELELICREETVSRAITLLRKYGVTANVGYGLECGPCAAAYLRRVAKAYSAIEGMAEFKRAGGSFAASWLTWFAVLFAGLGRLKARRLTAHLNLPRDVRECVLWVAGDLRKTHGRLSQMDGTRAYAVVKLLRDAPPEGIVHLFAVSTRRERNLISLYLRKWRHVSPLLTGARIVALGVSEGPMVGKILDRILRLRLAGKLAGPEEEIAYVRRQVTRLRSSRGDL